MGQCRPLKAVNGRIKSFGSGDTLDPSILPPGGDHNHDGQYAPLNHTHSYAPVDHEHTANQISDFQTAVSQNSDVAAMKTIIGQGVTDGDSLVDTLSEMLATFQTYSEGVDIATQLSDKEPANANIQTHIGSPHAPANAQKNSDITKSEIESKLTGEISSHTHPGGSGGTLYSFARVVLANATTTGQVLADIAGLTLPLLANSLYEFEAVLSVQSSSTAGNGYGVNFSAAGGTVEAQITGTLAAATQKTMRISGLNVAASPFMTVAGVGGILIKGIVSTGANPGNLTIKHLKVTSGTSTVFINSFLKVTKL